MDIIFQHIETRRIHAIEEMAKGKLAKLGQKFPWILRAELFFRNENGESFNQKICEIKLSVPGHPLFASCEGGRFEGALAGTIDDLERQLNKRKEMIAGH